VLQPLLPGSLQHRDHRRLDALVLEPGALRLQALHEQGQPLPLVLLVLQALLQASQSLAQLEESASEHDESDHHERQDESQHAEFIERTESKCIFTRATRVIVLSSLREGALVDSDDIENWNNQKRGPIEITVEVRECPRCRRVTDEGTDGPCVCVDEALGDLPT
jgi:hypothetical protein